MIGAGQAGLALGHHLVRAGADVVLLEQADRPGASWARRWDSLRLFTPARYDALPGSTFPAPRWSHPGKDEVAAYLARYADQQRIPVSTGARVVSLSGAPGRFAVGLADGRAVAARAVAVATGAFGRPWTPPLAAGLDAAVAQLHTDEYRNPTQLPPGGRVLVVGGGNSGYQVALELARAGHRVHLSEGTRPRSLPQRVAGRDLFWWLTVTGVVHAPATSRLGRRVQATEPVIGTGRRLLRRAGVTLHPRTVAADGRRLAFADGTSAEVDAVIWATGHRHDDRWIDVPGALDEAGRLVTADGVTAVAGLYTVGRSWQHSRGSALLGYVGRDAARIAARLLDEVHRTSSWAASGAGEARRPVSGDADAMGTVAR